MYQWLKDNWLRVVAVLFLLGTVTAPAYTVYYQLLNWFVLGAALTIAWLAKQQGKSFYMWLFVLMAVVFNPVAPLYLPQNTWRLLDGIAGLLLLASFFVVRPQRMV